MTLLCSCQSDQSSQEQALPGHSSSPGETAIVDPALLGEAEHEGSSAVEPNLGRSAGSPEPSPELLTCSLDHPRALGNYEAHGFRVFEELIRS